MSARHDDERSCKCQRRAEPLQPADMLHAESGRDQQHDNRRQRHDQRDVDRRGRDPRDIDRAAAEEHAKEARGEDRPRILDQRNPPLLDFLERERRQAEEDDRPAEERQRKGRHRPGEAARQDHVGDLRGRNQDKADQGDCACPPRIRCDRGGRARRFVIGQLVHIEGIAHGRLAGKRGNRPGGRRASLFL